MKQFSQSKEDAFHQELSVFRALAHQQAKLTNGRWHDDIKPENILGVQEDFKLADPGEARIKLAASEHERSTAIVTGGTRKYAAPEKARYLDGKTNFPSEVFQNSDVWSLGCVFSVAATYVVLGSQGISQYDKVRQHVFNIGSNADYHLVADASYDDDTVLEEVTQWHSYIRKLTRRTDDLTGRSAAQVRDEFEKLIERSSSVTSTASERIEDILHKINFDAGVAYEASTNEGSRLCRQGLGKPDDAPSSIARALEESLANDKGSSLGQHLMPTAQRLRDRRTLEEKTRAANRPPEPSQHNQRPAASKVPRPPMMTIHQLKGELRQLRKARSLNKLFESHVVAVKDGIFVVDNGDSMRQHWTEASYVLKLLVWRSLGYDDDGMELYFTNPATQASVKQRKTQKLEDFTNAMERADPHRAPPPGYKTNVLRKLDGIFSDYTQRAHTKLKPQTIIYLTDGAWQDSPPDSDLEDAIMARFKALAAACLPRTAPPASASDDGMDNVSKMLKKHRPTMIQFIAFGHNQAGIDRMKRLDDHVPNSNFPDFIDMEPSNGDVHKMFLGSLDPSWDQSENPVNIQSPYTWPRND
ncbi:hypothetical protein CSAL01_03108 [Colletotrichum salicis]|uniref:Protein kinase domain-containing protein n=1 Tax=Colletotrichum salicis TaxID=1209931 RepID=A0A135UTZ6_9PEZI|nr:hypothetical protein CSAL01_03108 [Colletotrichum salicis]